MVRQLGDANWGWVGVTLRLLRPQLRRCQHQPHGPGADPGSRGATRSRSACPARSSTGSRPPGWAASGSTSATCRSAAPTPQRLRRASASTACLGVVIHLTLTLLFVLWAGKENSFHFTLPKMPLLVGLLRRPRRRRRRLPRPVGPPSPAGPGPASARPRLGGRDVSIAHAAGSPDGDDPRRRHRDPGLPVRAVLPRSRPSAAGWRSPPSAPSTWRARPSARPPRPRAASVRWRRR